MKVAVFGAGGQLGNDLVHAMADWHVTPLQHAELDLCDYGAVRDTLSRLEPEAVINAAGYVRVDDAERHVDEAFRVNAFAVRNLAQVCADLDCVLMHVSTDYVFDGMGRVPYTETDCPRPINVYGASKLAGEDFVRALCRKHFVVRTSGLYGRAGSRRMGGNFVETIRRLAETGEPIRVVSDQVLTPTFTRDLAMKMKELLQGAAGGLYHITNAGECSWFEFASAILDRMPYSADCSAITSDELARPAPRPAYSVLASGALTAAGFQPLRGWQEALRDYLDQDRRA